MALCWADSLRLLRVPLRMGGFDQQMTLPHFPEMWGDVGKESAERPWAQRWSTRGSGAVVGHRLLDATACHLHRRLTWEDLLLLHMR
jgi:hypothetical protein